MIRKSEMKVYRNSSKIKKFKSAMLGGKSVDCRIGASLEHMRLSIGISFLVVVVVASFVQCIGATGTLSFTLYHARSDLSLLFLLCFFFKS